MEARDAARSRAAADEAKRRSIEVVNVGDHHMSRMYSTDHGEHNWSSGSRCMIIYYIIGRGTKEDTHPHYGLGVVEDIDNVLVVDTHAL